MTWASELEDLIPFRIVRKVDDLNCKHTSCKDDDNNSCYCLIALEISSNNFMKFKQRI